MEIRELKTMDVGELVKMAGDARGLPARAACRVASCCSG